MAGAATAGAVTDAQVRACVLNNLIRYAPPDRAVVAQYLDLEAACRARLEGAGGAQVTVTPQGGAHGAPGGGTGGGAGPSGGTGAPAEGAPSGPPPGGGTAPSPGGGPATAPAAPGAGGGGTRAGRTTTAPTAEPFVRDALARADGASVASPGGVAGAPVWVVVLVVGAIAAALAGAWIEVRRRPK